MAIVWQVFHFKSTHEIQWTELNTTDHKNKYKYIYTCTKKKDNKTNKPVSQWAKNIWRDQGEKKKKTLTDIISVKMQFQIDDATLYWIARGKLQARAQRMAHDEIEEKICNKTNNNNIVKLQNDSKNGFLLPLIFQPNANITNNTR